jgi:hypothetical protein
MCVAAHIKTNQESIVMNTKTQTTAESIENISMITKLLTLTYGDKDGVELVIDVKALMMADVGSENAYINITPICKYFNKRAQNFFASPNTVKYMQIVESKHIFKVLESSSLNNKNGSKYNKNNNLIDKNIGKLKLVIKKRGKHNSGTWIHTELFLKFASWVSVEFEYDMHQLIKQLIRQADHVKTDRASTKHLFHPLTDAIKDIWIPSQSENGKKFAYTNLANLINKKVIGMTAKQYKVKNQIDLDASIRDTFPDNILKKIEVIEKDMWGHIKYGKITEYEKLKDLI